MSSPTLEWAVPSAPVNGGVGTELIVEVWEPSGVDLTDKDSIRAVLMRGVKIGGSTLLRSYLHGLPPGRVTAFLLLQEPLISIHTWPDYYYAARDSLASRQ